MTLHDLSKEPVSTDDWPMILEEMVNGTDRSCALVGCSIVDFTLIQAIVSRMAATMTADEFEKLFYAQSAPLGTLSAKIKLGKAIGLYQSKVENALDAMRRIRNAFAHSAKPLPFTHPLIAEVLEFIQPALEAAWFAERGHDITHMSAEKAKYLSLCFELLRMLEHIAMLNAEVPIGTGWLDEEPTSPEISAPPPLLPDHSQDETG